MTRGVGWIWVLKKQLGTCHVGPMAWRLPSLFKTVVDLAVLYSYPLTDNIFYFLMF